MYGSISVERTCMSASAIEPVRGAAPGAGGPAPPDQRRRAALGTCRGKIWARRPAVGTLTGAAAAIAFDSRFLLN